MSQRNDMDESLYVLRQHFAGLSLVLGVVADLRRRAIVLLKARTLAKGDVDERS
jgi:hypothetical protein